MDVTEARRTEKALQEAEDHYRHMVELSPHVPWVLDKNGGVTDASFSRWQEFTGQPSEDAVGDGWQRMLHPDDVEPTRVAIRRSLATGEPIDVHYRVRRPGGDWNWMRARGSPRFAPSGEVLGIYGVVEPDGGLQHSEELGRELERCHIELQAAVDAAPVGLVLADGNDGTVVIVNPKAREIFRGRIFAGQKLMDFSRIKLLHLDGTRISPSDFPLVRAIQHGELTEARHILFERPDGTRIRLVASSRPIDAQDGKRIGALSMIQELKD
jgi:PAS domain S-box-containing protein